jgi:gliding motility-associated-like protein
MTRLKNITLSIGLLISSLSFGQGTDCANMGPICTDAGLAFTAQSGVPAASVTDPLNNYGCLGSTPNPTWYYLEISTAGNIDMSLSAPQDIDFIVYGPFTDLADAQGACGTMGSATAPQVDCSFSGTNMETPSIPGALVGEVYVMLITNYANSIQDVTLSQTGGTGETDCSIITACVSNPGTFTIKKNGIATALDLFLCADDIFSITNDLDLNGDPIYILPNDTVFAPAGDFDITAADPTTAQLMWLVYTQDPTDATTLATNQDPFTTPGFMGVNSIIPTEDLGGTTLAETTALMNSLGGCGTYWFAPVAGDDGIGNNNNVANGIDDNGGLHWDKNGNGCYFIGEAIKVTFACPIVAVPTIACGGVNGNSMDITITGGNGNYTIINQGAGNVLATPIPNLPGIATVTDLVNNSGWSIDISDQSGCEASANGIFDAPTIDQVVIISATSCSTIPSFDGSVSITLNTTGQAPYTVDMNTNLNVPGSPYLYDNGAAGEAVTINVTDDNGCTYTQIETITGLAHYIATTETHTDELCYNDATGTATITALGVDGSGVADGSNITSIEWEDPSGNIVGNTAATHLTQDNMVSGYWLVTISDDTGCSTTIPILIGGPQEIVLFASTVDNVTCFGGSDGNITVAATGGVNITGPSFTWSSNNPVINNADQTTNQCTIGTYKIYVTDANGCIDSLDVEITESDEIDITVVQAKLNVACYGAETGSIIIDTVYNAQGTYDYLWNLQPFYENPAVTSNIASGLGIGTYSVKIQDALGCFKIFDYTITQNDSLYWSELTITPAVCRNQVPFDNGSGQISAAVSRWAPGVGGSNISYQWTENETGDQPSANQTTWGNRNPGFYTMIAIDDHGCVLDTTIYLDSLSPNAIFDATSPQFTSNYIGTAPVEVTFTNSSTNYSFANLPVPYGNDPAVDTSMTWTFNLANDPYQTEEITPLTRIYDVEGAYTICLVVTENMNGCTDTACVDIQVYDVPSLVAPNVFTPNGDGENDKFFFPNHVITEFECTVFDRWGAEVYRFTSIEDAWDGTKFNNGSSECSDGVYFYNYTGESSNGTKYKGQGDLHLFRNK